MSPLIKVVAGAVVDADERVLIAQRPPGKHLAGGWEFPGGKLEPGEPRAAGLERELAEELGIVIRDPRPLMRIRHVYPYGEVSLDMWVVRRYEGTPRGMDGQALQWLSQDELAAADLLPADRPLVRALRLPERLLDARTAFYEVAESAARAQGRLRGVRCTTLAEAMSAAGGVHVGCDFLVMTATLPAGELEGLCESVMVPVYAHGLTLEEAWAAGATGVNGLTEC